HIRRSSSRSSSQLAHAGAGSAGVGATKGPSATVPAETSAPAATQNTPHGRLASKGQAVKPHGLAGIDRLVPMKVRRVAGLERPPVDGEGRGPQESPRLHRDE